MNTLAEARGPIPAGGLGLGLRPRHYRDVLEQRPAVDFFEAISENYLEGRPAPREHLQAVRAHYPIVLHGVGLSLLGHEPLDLAYLDAVARLAEWLDAPYFTDHLCWTRAHGMSHHDLLPVPYTEDLIGYAAERAAQAQTHVGRPFGLENLSSYLELRRSTLSEWSFYSAVVRDSGCWAMLDLNNVFVSSQNHGFDPEEYLAAIDFGRVLQVHVAGHTQQPDGLLVDTHDQPVRDEVWELYAAAWRRGGPFPTVLERDARMPPLEELVAELERTRSARADAEAR